MAFQVLSSSQPTSHIEDALASMTLTKKNLGKKSYFSGTRYFLNTTMIGVTFVILLLLKNIVAVQSMIPKSVVSQKIEYLLT